MALHLITGYAGTEHVTAANAGALNSHSFGTGRYVFNSGENFKAEIISNNDVRIYDGEGLFNGRYFNMVADTYEDMTIENGTQSMYRNDLIVARYQMDEDTGIESVALTVIKGTESSSTAEDPAYNDVSILDGNSIADFPLYRVSINGLSIDSVTALFSTIDNINTQLDTLKENLVSVNTALSSALVVEVKSLSSSISVSQGGTTSADYTCTKEGYTPISVQIANLASPYIYPVNIAINKTYITVVYTSWISGTRTVTPSIYVVYAKDELL